MRDKKDERDCFARHTEAVNQRKQRDREKGVTSWELPISIPDRALEIECFIEFQRQKIQKWQTETNNGVRRKRIGWIDESGAFSMKRGEHLLDDSRELENGEFWVACRLSDGRFTMPFHPSVAFPKSGELAVWKGGVSGDSMTYLERQFERFQKASLEREVTYRSKSRGKATAKIVCSMQCADCMTDIDSDGAKIGSEMTRAAECAAFAKGHLEPALIALRALPKDRQGSVAVALEHAFHAGQEGYLADQRSSIITDADYKRQCGETKRGPRSEWTAEARKFYTQRPNAKWWEAAEHLKKEDFIDYRGPDDERCGVSDACRFIINEGDFSEKNKDAFQKALRKQREKTPPKA